MLKSKLLHPEILGGLASAGHLAKVLISDGNYPSSTKPNPRAKIVWANFTPGVVDGCTMLRLVCQVIPVEAVEVMAPAKTGQYAMANDPPIWNEYRKILREHSDFRGEFIPLQKQPFSTSRDPSRRVIQSHTSRAQVVLARSTSPISPIA